VKANESREPTDHPDRPAGRVVERKPRRPSGVGRGPPKPSHARTAALGVGVSRPFFRMAIRRRTDCLAGPDEAPGRLGGARLERM